MTSGLRDVPGVPLALDTDLRNLLLSLREHVRAMRGFTAPGSGLVTSSSTLGGGSGVGEDLDPTPPPMPSGVVVVAGIDWVGITTADPIFTQGHGYGHTVVWGAKWPGVPAALPTFADAVIVHEFVGAVGSFPTDPSTQWHIWLMWQSADGFNSLPEGGTNGHQVITGVDVSLLLDALTGQITESQLWKDLGTTIKTFEPFVTYDFNGGTDGWTFSSITTTTGANAIVLDSGGTDPMAISPAVAIDGSRYDKVRARVKRNSGATFDGTIYYATAGHAFDAGYRKAIADATIIGEWVELEWDMAALTAGGNDWVTSTITQIRIDLGTAASDDFTVDWVSVGRRAAGVSSVRMGNAEVAISTETSVRASETGYIAGTYSVRTSVTQDGRTIVGGFGLTGTSGGTSGPTIDFGVRADKFWIGAPSGSTGVSDVMPFVVQTTDQVVNGVTIPKGVYMDAAYIKNLQSITARLGDAWITNAMVVTLAATKITAGSISAGEYVQSTGYVAGSTGWRISGNGNAEFSGVVVRGTIIASAGAIGGAVINATNVRSSGYVADTSGWSLDNSTGSIEANNLRVRGTLDIKSGTSGARQEIYAAGGKVFDASNVKRVQWGDLSL